MKRNSKPLKPPFVVCILFASCMFWTSACNLQDTKPAATSSEYQNAVSDFYISLAAIQSDQALFAVQKMQEVADVYPQEAAARANLAVLAVRLGNFELATQHIEKAIDLEPENANIHFLAGILESRRGNMNRALEYLKEAARMDPTNSLVLYALADELERQNSQANQQEVTRLFETILQHDPDNVAVLLEMIRTSAKWQDQQLLESTLAKLREQSKNWPESTQDNFRALEHKIESGQSDNLTFELAYLRNSLNQLPEFQYDLNQVQLPPNQIGFLVTEFLWLPQPSTSVRQPDDLLSFVSQPISTDTSFDLVAPVSLMDGETDRWIGIKSDEAYMDSRSIGAFPDANPAGFFTAEQVAMIDYNYDFRNDLAFAGSGGFILYETQPDTTFTDVTSRLQLPSSIRNGSYRAIWSRDIESDGDLDIVLSPAKGGVVVLQNNGDGTFSTTGTFNEVDSPVEFLWADLDGDADADAAFLTAGGEVQVYRNQRVGEFERDSTFSALSGTVDAAVADIDGNGTFDILSWNDEGIWKQTFLRHLSEWSTNRLIAFESPENSWNPATGRMFVHDLDNNGSRDILLSQQDRSNYWLSNDSLSFTGSKRELDTSIFGFSDLNSDSRLDGLGLEEGQPVALINKGADGYNARIIRPEASGPLGDRRINSFGIGGEMEIRSGLLYQRHLINRPWVHVGLGQYEEAEMLRIIWPNGSNQTEFAELGYGSKIMNEQLLKGSCPWVFAYNGQEMEFVTDFIWRTALGLRINAQGSATAIHSIDWIKIAGDQLKPRNGYYDIRITADLWETHFFDHVSLMVVDHPEEVEVMVDERFVLPAPEQKLYPLSLLRPIARAIDQDRTDVTQLVAKKDGRFVDTFELTMYQGLAREHYIEVHLGEDIPRDEPLYLVASGWIYPTDSSINVAISQGSNNPPHGIYLQVQDEDGKWRTVRDDIGFPAGKNKTILINLSDLPVDEVPQKVRLATNMEIYWDQITWAVGKSDAELKTRTLNPNVAELRYRGFSEVNRDSRFEPETPNYQVIAGTSPRWIDLIGHYTRFGDVSELTRKIDDRYVIMNAGDELVFRFPALPSPPKGWKRDFVLIGDGWVKDGDYNTGFSKTVLPLPYHGMEDYSQAPGRLEDDPVYQKHKEDWVKYHTRYITPYRFQQALTFDE